jgi:molecular chaperone GrpE (heat shock protein)
MHLSKNENFIKEYNNFKNRIERVKDEKQKKPLDDLLNEIVGIVKEIDKRTELLAMRSKMPNGGDEPRKKLLDLRKKLDSRLREYETVYKIK